MHLRSMEYMDNVCEVILARPFYGALSPESLTRMMDHVYGD